MLGALVERQNLSRGLWVVLGTEIKSFFPQTKVETFQASMVYFFVVLLN